MTEYYELRFSSDELNRVSISCQHCGGELVVALEHDAQRLRLAASQALHCTLCKGTYDSAVLAALSRLAECADILKRSEKKLTLCFRKPPTQG